MSSWHDEASGKPSSQGTIYMSIGKSNSAHGCGQNAQEAGCSCDTGEGGQGSQFTVGLIVEHGKGDDHKGQDGIGYEAGVPQLRGRDCEGAIRCWNV